MGASSSSVVRSFRFTATLTAQQVVTSLIRAMLSLGEARETAQRQMAAEEKKKGSKVCPQCCRQELAAAYQPETMQRSEGRA